MVESKVASDGEGKYHIVAALAAGMKVAIVIVGLLRCCWLIKFGSLELPVLMRYPLATPNLVIFC